MGARLRFKVNLIDITVRAPDIAPVPALEVRRQHHIIRVEHVTAFEGAGMAGLIPDRIVSAQPVHGQKVPGGG
jgi:hypothetical protein